jgi:cytochrome c-type biogenesis protein CcmH/NrfF
MKVRTVVIGRKALIFTVVSSIGLGLIVGYFLSTREGAHLAQAIIADLNCTCGCGRQLDPCECGSAEEIKGYAHSLVDAGDKRDEALDKLVEKYGLAVLLKDIPPGGKAELFATFSPREHKVTGEATRTIVVMSNDPDEPQKRVTISAEVKED